MSVNEEHPVTNASFAVKAFIDSCNRKFNMNYAHKDEQKSYPNDKINVILSNLKSNLMTYKILFEKALVYFEKIGDKGLWTKEKSQKEPNCPKICKHIQNLIDSISRASEHDLNEKMAVQMKRQFGHVIGKLRRNFPAFCIREPWYEKYVAKMNDMISPPSDIEKAYYEAGLKIIFDSKESKKHLFKDFEDYLYNKRMFTTIPTEVRYEKHVDYVNARKTGLVQSSTKPMFKSEPSFKSERKNKSERKFGNKKMVNIPKANDPKSELSTEALLMQMKSMQLSM